MKSAWVQQCTEPASAQELKVKSYLSWIVLAAMVVLGVFLARHLSQKDAEVREAREAFATQAERANAIVMSDDRAVIMCDHNQDITVYNSAAERLFGWTSDEMIGRSIHSMMPPDYREDHEDKLLEAIQLMESLDEQNAISRRGSVIGHALHKDGDEVRVSVTLRAIKYRGTVEFIAVIVPKESSDLDLPNIEPLKQIPQGYMPRR